MTKIGCERCTGGWRLVETADRSYRTRCDCWAGADRRRRLERAGVPDGLRHCDLDSFETAHHPRLKMAQAAAREFVDTFPLTGGTGLLFHGPVGTGKTHLAVAIVNELVVAKNARAVYLDFRKLLKTIQESWNPATHASEKQVLDRILQSDLLVLDDLGAEKPSSWVLETVSYVINERYVRGRPVVITTNLRYGRATAQPDEARARMSRRVGRPGSLGVDDLEERIGTASVSRLCEMCKGIDVSGVDDYRRKFKAYGAGKLGLG